MHWYLIITRLPILLTVVSPSVMKVWELCVVGKVQSLTADSTMCKVVPSVPPGVVKKGWWHFFSSTWSIMTLPVAKNETFSNSKVVREVPFWNALFPCGHCPNSFRPPPLTLPKWITKCTNHPGKRSAPLPPKQEITDLDVKKIASNHPGKGL